MFITILIITYDSYYHHETLQHKGFRIQLICSIVSWIVTIGLTIVQSTQVIKSGPVAVCRCEETTTKLFSIVVSFIFAVVLNVLICTLIKGMSKEQKFLVSKQDQSMLKTFIKKLITFNVPLILSIVYMAVRLPRKYYDEKTIGLFLVLLISETIRRMTGVVVVVVICFNETVWAELKGLCGKKEEEQGDTESEVMLTRITDISGNNEEIKI